MKKLIYSSVILCSVFLISCGGDAKKEGGASAEAPAASAAVNEAEWEIKDLKSYTKDTSFPAFQVKLPKDALIEPDTLGLDGTLHVTFKNKYQIMVMYSNIFIDEKAGLAGAIADQKQRSVTMEMADSDIKMLGEDSTGFAFTQQVKYNGKPTGEVLGHFYYFIANGKGGYMMIHDSPNGLINEEAEAVATADNTKKIRQIVASSAAFK